MSAFRAMSPRHVVRRFSTRRGVALATCLALAAALPTLSATATTTSDPAGPVVRNDSVTFTEDTGGVIHWRQNASSSYAVQTTLGGFARCIGDDPSSVFLNNSPRSFIEVKDPDGTSIFMQESPTRNLLSPGFPPANPQPTGRSVLNYRGGAWTTSALSLAGRDPGTYTVITTVHDRIKTGSGFTCSTGSTAVPTSGPVVTTTAFEYRPWQHQFKDLLGGGAVRMNVSPPEFQFDVSSGRSPLVDGAAGVEAMSFYALPDTAAAGFQLNPGACSDDPEACLPEAAIGCAAEAGCEPRLVMINYGVGPNKLIGLFDLETKAFVALATAQDRTRVLLSAGTELDSVLHGLLDELNATAEAAGIDLPALLNSTIQLHVQRQDGSTDVIQVGLLQALEYFTVPDGNPTGLGLFGPLSAGAGLVSHIGTWAGAPIDERFTDPVTGVKHSAMGYHASVAESLPAIPEVPVVGALVSGKLTHVVGRVSKNGGTHSVLFGADVDYDPVTGLPAHLPLVSTPPALPPGIVDSGMEFVGKPIVFGQLDLCGETDCAGFGLFVGFGAAVFGKLPVSLGDIPLLWGDQLGLKSTIDSVDQLVADTAAQVLSNPAVADTLETLLGPLGDLIPAMTP